MLAAFIWPSSDYTHGQTNLAPSRGPTRVVAPRALKKVEPPIKVDLSGAVAGLKIVAVPPDTPGARVGLKYGDVIIAYNKKPVSNQDEISAVMTQAAFQQKRKRKRGTAELALYRDGEMKVKTLMVPLGQLGIHTREWTVSGAWVEDAIVERNDYNVAEQYANDATESGQYTADQLLHMRVLCVNNEEVGNSIRQIQVDELFRSYGADKVTLFADQDLLYNNRYRAAAAIFERYLKETNNADLYVSTELNLASCYTEMTRYDDARALLNGLLARSAGDPNAPSDSELSALSNILGRIDMGQLRYDEAQERFRAAVERDPEDSYHTLAFLYCAALREIRSGKPGAFEGAYKVVSARSRWTEKLLGYHIDALRAFIMVRYNRRQEAISLVWKWKDSPDAQRYIPVFWSRFPEGPSIITNWNALVSSPH
jgi:tetratricopeptide (TPR) repeat protein